MEVPTLKWYSTPNDTNEHHFCKRYNKGFLLSRAGESGGEREENKNTFITGKGAEG